MGGRGGGSLKITVPDSRPRGRSRKLPSEPGFPGGGRPEDQPKFPRPAPVRQPRTPAER